MGEEVELMMGSDATGVVGEKVDSGEELGASLRSMTSGGIDIFVLLCIQTKKKKAGEPVLFPFSERRSKLCVVLFFLFKLATRQEVKKDSTVK